MLEDIDPDKQQYTVSSAIQMVEYRKTQQLTYAARCRHVLRWINGEFRIALKRVDLVNSTAVLSAMSIPI